MKKIRNFHIIGEKVGRIFGGKEINSYLCRNKNKMNKTIKRILKICGGIVAVVIILLVAAIVTINNKSFQKKILDIAVEELRLKLETHVDIDSISINTFTQDISLYGIEIEDREKRQMLRIEKIAVDLELLRLLQNKIVIEKAELVGAKALLLKPSKDEPANYQFVIDAFKKPKDKPKKEEKKKDSKMELDLSYASLKEVHVKHNELDINLQQVSYSNGWISGQTAKIEGVTLVCDTTFKEGLKPYKASLGSLTAKGDLMNQVFKVDAYDIEYQWQSLWKKRNIMVDNLAAIGHLTANVSHGRYSATVKQAHYKNDNHLPRKNTGKPKRGFFDAKHLDVIADFHVVLDSISKNGITGIDVRKLQAIFKYEKDKIELRDIIVQQKSTVLNITSGAIVLPSKKEGREFSYSTGVITGTAYLKDISRAFAPVLKNFTLREGQLQRQETTCRCHRRYLQSERQIQTPRQVRHQQYDRQNGHCRKNHQPVCHQETDDEPAPQPGRHQLYGQLRRIV